MDTTELELEKVNFGEVSELLNLIISAKFIKFLEKEALGDFVSTGIPQEFKIAKFKTRTMSLVDLQNREAFKYQMLEWIKERQQFQQSLGPVIYIEAKWRLWNEVDPLCNHDLMTPYWEISLLYA